MTGIYLGRRTFDREINEGRFFMSGDARLSKTIKRWLKLSLYAETDGVLRADLPT